MMVTDSNNRGEEPSLTTSLILSGEDFDFEDCSSQIGLQSTKVWHPPSKRIADAFDLPKSTWSFAIEKSSHDSVDTALQELLETVWPLRNKIRDFAQKNSLQISFVCTVTILSERPVYELSSETMAKLSWFNADFSMDIFDYSEED